MLSDRPIVAVTLCGHERRRCLLTRTQYLDAIRSAGGEPVPVDPGGEAPDEFAGLCLTGGGDLDPGRYGEENAGSIDIDVARDELEFGLVRRALDGDLPVLGICRGLQVLNVVFGGTLEQHRRGHSPQYSPAGARVEDDPLGSRAVQHRLSAVPGTLLASACGDAPFIVNSSHHQVVTPGRLAPSLRATAEVDGIVEAIESPAHRWVAAVQWHPERVGQVDVAATRIFAAFVRATESAARADAVRRGGPALR